MTSAPASKKANNPAADETTPLLATSATGSTAQANEEAVIQETSARNNGDDKSDDKPLPRGQIFLLCFARLVEPIAFFSIFPFINKMIWETGNLKEADVGFYSGLIESLFSLTQMLLMISWGRASDRFGRKPVLVFSLVGVAIGTALFGLSKTIWQMIVFRCFAGLFAGTIVTVRTMISENSTPKTQARAFSFFAFSGNLGIFLGPLLGGSLTNPAAQYPSVFGRFKFFKMFPYALPTFVTGTIGASAAIVSALFIKETLNRKDKDVSSTDVPKSTWQVIKSPGVSIVLFIYGHVMLLALAYTAVAPVFWFTPVELGGYGFSPLQISLFLGTSGLSQSLWLLLAFPPLQHRFGTGGVLRGCAIFWPFLFASCLIGNILLRHDWKVAFWIVAPVGQIAGAGVAMAFTCVQLALNDIVPSPSSLGTLNGVALTFVSGIRAVAPAMFSSIFATGARTQIMDGHLVWVVMLFLAFALIVALRWLPAKAEGKLKDDDNTE